MSETTILIADGKTIVRRGKARTILVSEIKEVANSNGINLACIHASSVGHTGFKLSLFGIPDKLHQRFRNVWAANWI